MPTPGRIDTEERRKADRVRQRLAKEVTAIQGQRNLTREGKRSRLAAAVVKAQAELGELRAAEAQRVTARREQCERELFGHVQPDDTRVISIRDAADRAAQIKDPEQMAAWMERVKDHDEVLLQAFARECYTRRNAAEPVWQRLVETWVRQTGRADAAEELGIIRDETSDSGHRLTREAAFSVGLLPAEIHGVSNSQLRSLADQADQIEELPPSRAEQVGQRLAGMVHTEIE
ncbi:MAG TPA: hypothetical protein VFO16_09825 [Pseudonocardiaceae bacterium]|nr:hypothetical protein [Pseudonocardiaceae bacterium]